MSATWRMKSCGLAYNNISEDAHHPSSADTVSLGPQILVRETVVAGRAAELLPRSSQNEPS